MPQTSRLVVKLEVDTQGVEQCLDALFGHGVPAADMELVINGPTAHLRLLVPARLRAQALRRAGEELSVRRLARNWIVRTLPRAVDGTE